MDVKQIKISNIKISYYAKHCRNYGEPYNSVDVGVIIAVVKLQTLFTTKPDKICLPCKPRVCKFLKNSVDDTYLHP